MADEIRMTELVPEWPGQTHIWMWREATELRKLGVEISFTSTRPPCDADAAKHEFIHDPLATTSYLWPTRVTDSINCVLWAALHAPRSTVSALVRVLSLPLEGNRRLVRAAGAFLLGCKLAKQLSERKVRFLHVQSLANCAVIALVAHKLTGVPYCIVVNANLDWWGGAVAEKLRDASFVVTHAKWIREELLERFAWLKPEKVVLAPVGVDTAAWCPAPESKLTGARFKLLSVGRLHPSKGHSVVIEAVDILRSRGVDVHLSIVGDGPDRTLLASLILAKGLQDHVCLMLTQSGGSVLRLLQQSDAFVLASKAEPLGVVYMEAMAAGLPTIGTNAGGVTEIITDGKTGLLVAPDDPNAVAASVQRLIESPSLATQLGAAGRTFIQANFDSAMGAKKLESAIRRAVNGHEQ
ncbi:MAG: glycosyltransferase family 4 protein [Planctomycetota bacterium]|nr:glycosyltransferase family 4 protein [Planctomycetota bacterium]